VTDDLVARETNDSSGARSITDPIGLTLTAIGAGAASGAFVITLGVVALRLVQSGAGQTEANPTDFTLLSAAVMAGPVVAVTMTLVATRAIGDLWRRGVASAIAVFSAFLLSALTAPLDMVAGRAGVILFAITLLGATVALARRARRIALQ